MYSGFWRRFAAWFIDCLFLGVVGMMLMWIVPFAGGILVWFFYAPMLEASAAQATLGKHVMGIQVTDIKGDRITFAAAIIRNLMKFVSGAILCVGYFVMLFTQRKQALHDLVAETTVVMGQSSVQIPDAWLAQVKDVFRVNNTVGPSPTGSVVSQPIGADASPEARASVGSDIADQLSKIQAMRDRGELTQGEYEIAKRKILS